MEEHPEEVEESAPAPEDDAQNTSEADVAEPEAEVVAYDDMIAPSPEPPVRGYEQSVAAASAAVHDAPDVDWNAMVQSCTRVLKNYQGFADLHAVVEHATRLDGYRRELIRVIELNEGIKARKEAELAAFEADMARQRESVHAQLVNEQQRTANEIQELAAKRELAHEEARREEQECEQRIQAAQQRARDEEARIEVSMGDMRKAEESFKKRMRAMRGQIEQFTQAEV